MCRGGSLLGSRGSKTIPAGGRRTIPTGIAIALPSADYVALVYARSGLGVKHGVAPAAWATRSSSWGALCQPPLMAALQAMVCSSLSRAAAGSAEPAVSSFWASSSAQKGAGKTV